MADHTGHVKIENKWGTSITSIFLRHRRGNDESKEESTTFINIPNKGVTENMDFTYTTGAASPFDYWWIKFVTLSDDTFTCKNNFYCSVDSDDNGYVTIKLNGDDEHMYVNFSDSSGCKCSLKKE